MAFILYPFIFIQWLKLIIEVILSFELMFISFLHLQCNYYIRHLTSNFFPLNGLYRKTLLLELSIITDKNIKTTTNAALSSQNKNSFHHLSSVSAKKNPLWKSTGAWQHTVIIPEDIFPIPSNSWLTDYLSQTLHFTSNSPQTIFLLMYADAFWMYANSWSAQNLVAKNYTD